MNLYTLDESPAKSAQMLHDRDVVRGAFASVSTLLAHMPYSQLQRWQNVYVARRSWLLRTAIALHCEYTHRYGREHKLWEKLRDLRDAFVEPVVPLDEYPLFIPQGYWSRPPFVPPALEPGTLFVNEGAISHGLSPEETIAAHRRYYIMERRRGAKYTRRTPPDWLAAALKQPPTLPIVVRYGAYTLVGIPVKIEATQVRVSLYNPHIYGMPAVGDTPLVVRYNDTCMSDTYTLGPRGSIVLKELRTYA